MNIFAVAMLMILCGCTASKLYPLPESGVIVKEDMVYQDGTPLAELRYLVNDKEKKVCRGVAIYYYRYDKEIWICPKEGWHYFEGKNEISSIRDIERIWNSGQNIRSFYVGKKRADKTEFITTWCHDIRLSSDAKYVFYKTPRILFDSDHTYLVEYGVSK